jgi:hypothetical protein
MAEMEIMTMVRTFMPGVFYELHLDGYEKLNFKALRMGPIGIIIYMVHAAIPAAKWSSFWPFQMPAVLQ